MTAAPTPTAAPVCSVGTRGTPDIADTFTDHLPHHFLVKEICASEVGPALAGRDAVAGLSDLAAAEVAESYSSPDRVVLKALVGHAESGEANAFVQGFLSRVGATRNDTVTLDGRTVRYFNTPGGEGYAYAEVSTVFIGYIPPTPAGYELAPAQEGAKELFTRIVLAATGAPIPADDLTHPKTGASTRIRRGGAATPRRTTRAGSSSRPRASREHPPTSAESAPAAT